VVPNKMAEWDVGPLGNGYAVTGGGVRNGCYTGYVWEGWEVGGQFYFSFQDGDRKYWASFITKL